MKLYNYIKGIAISLLFFVPLIYLYNYCDELEARSIKLSNELIKNKLLSEMDRFQERLKPEKYIEFAFRDLEKSFKLPELDNSQFKFTYSEEDKPDFIDKDFVKKSKAFLKEKYFFEPFVFVSSGFDFTNMNIDDKDSIFKEDSAKNEFLNSCIHNIISLKRESIVKNNLKFIFKPCLPSYEKHFEDVKDRIFPRDNENKRIFDLKKIDLPKAKYISIFSKKIDQPQDCLSFFSNVFGNENIYQYYNIFLKNNKGNYNFLGLYYVLVKSTDIKVNKIIDFALENSSYEFSHITRNISSKIVSLPSWDFSDSEIKYNVPFPFYFYNFIEKQKTKNEDLYKYFIEYIKNHSLELRIKKSHLDNSYSEYKDYIKALIIVIFLALLLYFINVQLNIFKKTFLLSLKIRLIVLIAVSIPLFGFFIIVNFTMKNEEKNLLSNIENKMSERINFFDKLKEDVFNGFTFDLLEHKRILSEIFFKDKSEDFIKQYTKKTSEFINENELKNVKKNIQSLFRTSKNLPYVIIDSIHLLDKNGNNIGFNRNDYFGNVYKFTGYFTLYRFLSSMNLLNLNSPINKKVQSQAMVISSSLDDYMNTHNNRNELAREGQLIPNDATLTLKDKIVYQLLASSKKPSSPEALVHNWVNWYNIMSFRLTDLIVKKYPKLLEQKIELTEVKYAFFERDASEVRERISQAKTYPYWQMQLESARKALKKGKSGSEIVEKEDCYYYKRWRFYEDNPIVIVGVAIIPKVKQNMISKGIIFLLLLIYCCMVVALISDLLSKALLEPIRILSKFVKEIGIGHINVEIDMKTGDELEKLGNSFNKMSEGLCEREKLKRFVSDKLLSSLEGSNESKITKAKVTVLSSDIRSFTTISEKNSPEAVVSLLNEYFTLMEKSIVKYGGSIEKIVGDAISAAFYEEKSEEYSLNACKAALEMRENLIRFNIERKSKGLFTIENGIGLATGEVMIGFAGEKARRREFLLIGNILKQAENLESMTKIAASSKVFIDEQTFEKVKYNLKFCEIKKDSDIFYREIML